MNFTEKPAAAFPAAAIFKTSYEEAPADSMHSAPSPVFEDIALTPFAPPVEIQSDTAFYQAAGSPNPFADAEPAQTSFLEPVVPAVQPSASAWPEPTIPASSSFEPASEPEIVPRRQKASANPVKRLIKTFSDAFESLRKRLPKPEAARAGTGPSPEPVVAEAGNPINETRPFVPAQPRNDTDAQPVAAESTDVAVLSSSGFASDERQASKADKFIPTLSPRDHVATLATRRHADNVVPASVMKTDPLRAVYAERSRSLAISVLTISSPRLLVFHLDNQLLVLPIMLSFEIYGLTYRRRFDGFSHW